MMRRLSNCVTTASFESDLIQTLHKLRKHRFYLRFDPRVAIARISTTQSDMQEPNTAPPTATTTELRILEQIECLRREWQARRSTQQPVPSCIVRAYHELLDRHYRMLDGPVPQPLQRSINIP